MLGKPALTSKADLPGVQNRFEDFMGDHIRQTNFTHFVGLFYPRHRLLVWAYEQEIRACGFRGAQPYWDWSLDSGSADDFFHSPVFDTKTGFGGNGEFLPFNSSGVSPQLPITDGKIPSTIADRSGGGCIHDGPFFNMTIHMGPGASTAYHAQCVRRDFVPSYFMSVASPEAVSTSMNHPDFGSFTRQTELAVHGAGHSGVGGLYGVLTDAYASPGDPLFYLHHANMDRLWWSWQSKNLSSRLTDISGPIIANDWLNEKGRNVTLDGTVFVGTTVNVTMPIRDVMDIRKSLGYINHFTTTMMPTPEPPQPPRRPACTLCKVRKVKCDRDSPCMNCVKSGVDCIQRTNAKTRDRKKPTIELQRKLDLCERMIQQLSAMKRSPEVIGTRHSGGGEANEEIQPLDASLGKLVIDEGSVRFTDNTLWAAIFDEASYAQKVVSTFMSHSF
ncbi:hypothetical protein CSIM01_13881 [Colletotrichum simmondsii]|uniref:Zn(2)-C6 fungal-type domain-containing protein n=1 Tax=Colletotrichum simmondsii TaxID=703756 RepID=A0A135SXA3_9PEZI|nr:hypothetical protein CSIM01_13881 [Colletotrichum simmondsii]